MFTKSLRILATGLGLLFAAIVVPAFQGVTNVRAAVPAQESSPSACLGCHENQYYLRDSGHWYCVSEARDRCINCHGGNPAASSEAEAHAGMSANPFADDGAHCRDCHAGETDALIDRVTGLTGYHAPVSVEAYAPADVEMADLLEEPESTLWMIPVAGVVFALWAWLVLKSR